MQLLFDFFPIILFFIAFKFLGIFWATFVAMVASILQVTGVWIRHKRISVIHFLNLTLILFLGSATIFLHNIMFIKWKPTVVYWVLALFFAMSKFFGEKTLLQRMMDNKINLPNNIWFRLNLIWISFFVLMGLINLYVVYHFPTNTWVNFKLFGILGITVAFVILQSFYMTKYAKNDKFEKVTRT